MIRASIATLATLLALSGCGAISAIGDASTPLSAYELSAPREGPTARRTVARELVIELPSTSGALATDRIMIRTHPLEAQYLPGARWSAETPDMLQTMMLRAVENTNGLRYVGRRPLSSSGDYALITELTDFQAEVTGDGTGANTTVRIIARLVREEDATVIGQRSFRASAAAATTETLTIVQSFSDATDVILAELTGWVLERVGAGIVAPSG